MTRQFQRLPSLLPWLAAIDAMAGCCLTDTAEGHKGATSPGEVRAMTRAYTRRVHQGIHISLLAAFACAAVQAVGAADSAQSIPRPRPIQAALNLLHWPAAQTPTIVVVPERPPMVNTLAEGWVVYNSDGCAQPTIYVAGWSELYRDSLERPHVWHNLIRLAGVLTHERVHIRHGPDEELAYAEQLIALEQWHATLLEVSNLRRALQLAICQREDERSTARAHSESLKFPRNPPSGAADLKCP